jgi:predicted membrane metal-binding protein
VKKFTRFLPDQEASSMASTLILGYRVDLNKDLIEAYSKTGTMHVLSVPGMHVGIVFLVLSFLLKPMDRSKNLILLRAIIIIAVIWFYSLLTGFSPSVCRSALMLSFVVLGKAMNKNQNTYNLIAISAFFCFCMIHITCLMLVFSCHIWLLQDWYFFILSFIIHFILKINYWNMFGAIAPYQLLHN